MVKKAKGRGSATRTESTGQDAKRSVRSRRKTWTFRLTAVLISLLLLVGFEAALRLAGVGYEPSFIIPSELQGSPTYRANLRFSWRFFPRSIARKPMPFHIAREKDSDTCRVFVLGASAAHGHPDPAYGIARMVRVMLEDAYPERKFEVVSATITAINSHVATEIARDCARHSPDLFIVYLGNNEVVGPYGPGTVFSRSAPSPLMIRLSKWTTATRTGQLIQSLVSGSEDAPKRFMGLELFLDKQVRAADRRMRPVYRHFRHNLSSIVATARRASVPLILCTVGVNLRDSAPFASLHRPDLSAAEERRWQELYGAAQREESQDRREAALALYEKALAIDNQYADLHFRLARCYEAEGKFERARDHYVKARDLDTLRFRCDSELNRVIRDVGAELAESDVHLIDVERILEDDSAHGVPGRELFHEHVHLTFRGNYLIARAVARKAAALTGQNERRVFEPLSEEECGLRLCHTGFNQHRVLKMLVEQMSRPPFTNQLDHEEQIRRMEAEIAELERFTEPEGLREAAAVYESRISAGQADWMIGNNYAFLLSELGEKDRALDLWNRAKLYYADRPSER
jgi:tetratricopeptide (TPR) repeat protein